LVYSKGLDSLAIMTFWLTLPVVAALLIMSIFGYVAVYWRRVPMVYRALNRVASASAVAGILLSLPIMHWIGASPSGASASSEWQHIREAVEGVCPSDGVPAPEVSKALVLTDEHHAGEPNWASSGQQAELCKEGGPLLSDSQICVETFIARHALGLDLKYGDHRSLIPCEEVAEFCDSGALDKASTLCTRAYRTRNARLGAGT
jgi:hypothetical protein